MSPRTPAQDRILALLDRSGTTYEELMRLTGMVRSGVQRALLALERQKKAERIVIGPPARRRGKHWDERVRAPRVVWRKCQPEQ